MLEEISATQVESAQQEDDGVPNELPHAQLEDDIQAQVQQGPRGDHSDGLWAVDVDMDD